MRNDGILKHIESSFDHEVNTIRTPPEYKPSSMSSTRVLFVYFALYFLTVPPLTVIGESMYRNIRRN